MEKYKGEIQDSKRVIITRGNIVRYNRCTSTGSGYARISDIETDGDDIVVCLEAWELGHDGMPCRVRRYPGQLIKAKHEPAEWLRKLGIRCRAYATYASIDLDCKHDSLAQLIDQAREAGLEVRITAYELYVGYFSDAGDLERVMPFIEGPVGCLVEYGPVKKDRIERDGKGRAIIKARLPRGFMVLDADEMVTTIGKTTGRGKTRVSEGNRQTVDHVLRHTSELTMVASPQQVAALRKELDILYSIAENVFGMHVEPFTAHSALIGHGLIPDKE